MNEPLKCTCGNRRLNRTEVIGDDGNPFVGEWGDVYHCPACGRALKIVADGENNVKLQVVVAHSSVVAWRTL